MRLGMLKTAHGPRLVGITPESEAERFVDLCAVDDSLPPTLIALLAEKDGLARAAMALATGTSSQSFVTGTLSAPISRPGKVICIGLNYKDHAAESGMAIPSEPVCFSKFSSAVVGPGDTILLPRVSEKVDYEAELVVVIGRRGKNIPEKDALGYVAGYMNGNDVSARDWQIGRPGSQWLLGKTPDTFAPTGPYLVTADEVGDPHELSVELRLNGQTMQKSSTRELIFGIDRLIAHLSQLVTLEPGDLIFTGTPPGVGMARKPPVFLKGGDIVEVQIQGLGALKNPVATE